MIDIGQHAEYILGAYAITGLLVGTLIIWINRDYAIQEKRLKDLEAKGIRRRSDKKKA